MPGVDVGPYQTIVQVGWSQPFLLLAMMFERVGGALEVEFKVDDLTVDIRTIDGNPATDVTTGKDYLNFVNRGTFSVPNTDDAPYPFPDGGGHLGLALQGRPAVFDAAGVLVFNPDPRAAESDPTREDQINAALASHNIPGMGSEGTPSEEGGGWWRLAATSGDGYFWSYIDECDPSGTIVLGDGPTNSGIVPVQWGCGPSYTAFLYRFYDPHLPDYEVQWVLAYIDPRLIFHTIQQQSAQPLSYFVRVTIRTGGGTLQEGVIPGNSHGHYTLNGRNAFEFIGDLDVPDGTDSVSDALASLRLTANLKAEGDFSMTAGDALTGPLIDNTNVTVQPTGVSFGSA